MRYLLFLFLVFALIPPAQALEQESVGSIKAVEGVATLIRNKEKSEIALDAPIYLSDTISVENDALVHVAFIDNTALTLGGNTILVIDEYVYDAENADKNKASFSLKKGAFHYISGLIAKKEKPAVTLNLDFGSIGIRGTQIWRDMVPGENGKPQCRIYVEGGVARISNPLGFVTLKDGFGTSISSLDSAPETAKAWGEIKIAEIKAQSFIEDLEPALAPEITTPSENESEPRREAEPAPMAEEAAPETKHEFEAPAADAPAAFGTEEESGAPPSATETPNALETDIAP